jgi:hypothetical protein
MQSFICMQSCNLICIFKIYLLSLIYIYISFISVIICIFDLIVEQTLNMYIILINRR